MRIAHTSRVQCAHSILNALTSVVSKTYQKAFSVIQACYEARVEHLLAQFQPHDIWMETMPYCFAMLKYTFGLVHAGFPVVEQI